MMESEVTGNCHASFGERDAETRLARAGKVRCVPTPLSPLLANIALHGLETAITSAYPDSIVRNNHRTFNWQPRVIRYADDFVILHPEVEIIEETVERAKTWLKGMGLELKPSKTTITHTLTSHNGKLGFDFLGFNVRQHPVGKCQRRTSGGRSNVVLDFKTIIRPSKTAMQRHYRALAETVNQLSTAPQIAVIAALNPQIRGWCNFYATVVSKRAFDKLRMLLYRKLYRWATRRHPHEGKAKMVRKYWTLGQKRRWDFATKEGAKLISHAHIPIRRHIQVNGRRSPYDGDWAYWATRQGRDPLLPTRVAKLMRWQKGRCPWCGSRFKYGDMVEVDHLIPRSQGGQDMYRNLQLLHGHCHDAKSAREASMRAGGTNDNRRHVEEPCEDERLMHGFEDESVGRPAGLV